MAGRVGVAGRPAPTGDGRLASAGVTVPPMHPVDVLLVLAHAGRVLLALRDGTGYADGQWNLPSDKLEHGEDALSAVIREAREEIGVRLAPGEPHMVATVHPRNTAGGPRDAVAPQRQTPPGAVGRRTVQRRRRPS